jgi:hypothetical protein
MAASSLRTPSGRATPSSSMLPAVRHMRREVKASHTAVLEFSAGRFLIDIFAIDVATPCLATMVGGTLGMWVLSGNAVVQCTPHNHGERACTRRRVGGKTPEACTWTRSRRTPCPASGEDLHNMVGTVD